MILLLALDYILGEMAYPIFDRVLLGVDVFFFYFLALMGIEGIICKLMLDLNTKRATAYATLNIIAIGAHLYGLYVFTYWLNSSAYTSMLMTLLYAKIAVVVLPDVRNHIRHSIDSIRDSLVYRPSFLFIATAFGAIK